MSRMTGSRQSGGLGFAGCSRQSFRGPNPAPSPRTRWLDLFEPVGEFQTIVGQRWLESNPTAASCTSASRPHALFQAPRGYLRAVQAE